MKLNQLAIAILFATGLSVGAYASGSGESGHGDSTAPQQQSDGHADGDSHSEQGGDHMDGNAGHGAMATPDRTIEIVARDIAFSVSEIAVSQGETIRFVIRNEGMIDHDFTIGDRTTQNAHREEMMEMMMSGMMEGHAHEVSNAVMIPPGETRELIWTFSEDQQIEFGCNVPGHYEAGMNGAFVIER